MQWMLIEKEGEIEHAMYVGSRTIWPETVGKGRKEREE